MLLDEWYEGNGTRDLAQLSRTLAEWLAVYNWVRPHHALGLRTPAVAAEQAGVLSRGGSSRAGARIHSHAPGGQARSTEVDCDLSTSIATEARMDTRRPDGSLSLPCATHW
jgi:Integrase core domain